VRNRRRIAGHNANVKQDDNKKHRIVIKSGGKRERYGRIWIKVHLIFLFYICTAGNSFEFARDIFPT
jgi:hypothetical protein